MIYRPKKSVLKLKRSLSERENKTRNRYFGIFTRNFIHTHRHFFPCYSYMKFLFLYYRFFLTFWFSKIQTQIKFCIVMIVISELGGYLPKEFLSWGNPQTQPLVLKMIDFDVLECYEWFLENYNLNLHTELRQNEYVNELQPWIAHSNYHQLCMKFFQAICSEK